MLSESTILDLQKILLEEFNLTYSKAEVNEIATSLVSFAEVLVQVDNQHHEKLPS